MTKAEEIYASTLNWLGCQQTPEEPCIQVLLDAEHHTADPSFEIPDRHIPA
jgi:hypothetical protein